MIIKIITILYVLPLIFSLIIAYKISKDNKSSIKELLEMCCWCLIPIFNIFIVIIAPFLLIRDFLKENAKFQNFLNKKL